MSSENKGVPKVSVIIPGWNERKNIEKCIQNYQSQTYDNFNLILVLGGEDPYIEKAKHHKWEKLIVLDQIEPNKSKALNIGVKHPEAGDLLVFTDMDCRVPDDYIQRYIEKFEDPQINVMAGRSQPYQEDKTLLADYILGNERRRLKNKPEKGYYITGRNFACRKRFLVEKLSGFDEDVKISMDSRFTQQLGEIKEPIFLDKENIVYSDFNTEDLKAFVKQQSRWFRNLIIFSKDFLSKRTFYTSLFYITLGFSFYLFLPLIFALSLTIHWEIFFWGWIPYISIIAWLTIILFMTYRKYLDMNNLERPMGYKIKGSIQMALVFLGVYVIATFKAIFAGSESWLK